MNDAPMLDAVLAQAWAQLMRGAQDRRGAAHTPTLASVDAHGLPQLRTVVLRHCDPAARELLIHTDRRSPKVAELRAQPRCALHVYDAAEKVQLRLHALASLHVDDALADRQWSHARPMSRATYGSPLAPGLPLDDPQTGTDALANRSEAEQRAHFMVLRLHVRQIDWLYLRAQGHRRARFAWSDASGALDAIWCVP